MLRQSAPPDKDCRDNIARTALGTTTIERLSAGQLQLLKLCKHTFGWTPYILGTDVKIVRTLLDRAGKKRLVRNRPVSTP